MSGKFIRRDTLRYIFSVLLMLFISGCGKSFIKEDAEERVRQRAELRWEALIDGRFESLYAFETPEFRKTYTFKQFKRITYGYGFWYKAEVRDVDCTEKKCIVKLMVHAIIKPGRGFSDHKTAAERIEEWSWDQESGEWYHYQRL